MEAAIALLMAWNPAISASGFILRLAAEHTDSLKAFFSFNQKIAYVLAFRPVPVCRHLVIQPARIKIQGDSYRLATLLAIHLGFAAVILLAVLCYALACVALRRFA